MRAALPILVLALAIAARAADDDDQLLETKPLGEAIPERMRTLEREWADDVGIHEAPEEPGDESPFEGEEAVAPPEPSEGDEHPVAKPPVVEEPAHPKAAAGSGASRPADVPEAPEPGARSESRRARPGDPTGEAD